MTAEQPPSFSGDGESLSEKSDTSNLPAKTDIEEFVNRSMPRSAVSSGEKNGDDGDRPLTLVQSPLPDVKEEGENEEKGEPEKEEKPEKVTMPS